MTGDHEAYHLQALEGMHQRSWTYAQGVAVIRLNGSPSNQFWRGSLSFYGAFAPPPSLIVRTSGPYAGWKDHRTTTWTSLREGTHLAVLHGSAQLNIQVTVFKLIAH